MCDFTPDIPKAPPPPAPPGTGPKLANELDTLGSAIRGQSLTIKRPRGVGSLKVQRDPTGVNLPGGL